jgi:hypothetical protein
MSAAARFARDLRLLEPLLPSGKLWRLPPPEKWGVLPTTLAFSVEGRGLVDPGPGELLVDQAGPPVVDAARVCLRVADGAREGSGRLGAERKPANLFADRQSFVRGRSKTFERIAGALPTAASKEVLREGLAAAGVVVAADAPVALSVAVGAVGDPRAARAGGYTASVVAATDSGRHSQLEVIGHDTSGAFHGAQSLLALLARGTALPALTVVDAPRLAYRGVQVGFGRIVALYYAHPL